MKCQYVRGERGVHNVYQKFLTNKWHMSESANQLMYCLSLPRTLLPVEVLVPGVNSLSKHVVFLQVSLC